MATTIAVPRPAAQSTTPATSSAPQAITTDVLERNKALVRRVVDELWNAKRLDVADEIFAKDCIPHSLQHSADQLGDRRGPKHIKLIITAWYAAFPDWHITVTDLVAEGDRVVLITSGRGTHKGRLMGLAPTGKRVTLTGVRVFRIAAGKIVEYWALWDWQGLWQQLGARPPQR
jgi:predicted ester cyclase